MHNIFGQNRFLFSLSAFFLLSFIQIFVLEHHFLLSTHTNFVVLYTKMLFTNPIF